MNYKIFGPTKVGVVGPVQPALRNAVVSRVAGTFEVYQNFMLKVYQYRYFVILANNGYVRPCTAP